MFVHFSCPSPKRGICVIIWGFGSICSWVYSGNRMNATCVWKKDSKWDLVHQKPAPHGPDMLLKAREHEQMSKLVSTVRCLWIYEGFPQTDSSPAVFLETAGCLLPKLKLSYDLMQLRWGKQGSLTFVGTKLSSRISRCQSDTSFPPLLWQCQLELINRRL